MSRLGLVDYGMGNLLSVQQAFMRLDRSLHLVQEPSELSKCDALILPGVGAFDPAMANLQNCGLASPLKDWAEQNRPLLGICLGLQLFFESSVHCIRSKFFRKTDFERLWWFKQNIGE